MVIQKHLEIAFHSTPVSCDAVSLDGDGNWYLIECKPLRGQERQLDALQVRDEFLLIDSESELKAFLERTGCFDQKAFLIRDLRRWQSLIKALLTTSPSRWRETLQDSDENLVQAILAHRNLSVHLPIDGSGSSPAVMAFNTLEAIMASILADHLHGVRHAICEREDCAKLFRVESQRARMFCTRYCGHLVSLRRSRSTKAAGSGSPNKRKRTHGSSPASAL